MKKLVIVAFLVFVSMFLGGAESAKAVTPCWNGGTGCFHWPDAVRPLTINTRVHGNGNGPSGANFRTNAVVALQGVGNSLSTINTYVTTSDHCPFGFNSDGTVLGQPANPNVIDFCFRSNPPHNQGGARCGWMGAPADQWVGCMHIYWVYWEWNGSGWIVSNHVYQAAASMDSTSYYNGNQLTPLGWSADQLRELVCHEVGGHGGMRDHTNPPDHSSCVIASVCAGAYDVYTYRNIYVFADTSCANDLGSAGPEIDLEHNHPDAAYPNRAVASGTGVVVRPKFKTNRAFARWGASNPAALALSGKHKTKVTKEKPPKNPEPGVVYLFPIDKGEALTATGAISPFSAVDLLIG